MFGACLRPARPGDDPPTSERFVRLLVEHKPARAAGAETGPPGTYSEFPPGGIPSPVRDARFLQRRLEDVGGDGPAGLEEQPQQKNRTPERREPV
jgi:hypothetical protein